MKMDSTAAQMEPVSASKCTIFFFQSIFSSEDGVTNGEDGVTVVTKKNDA